MKPHFAANSARGFRLLEWSWLERLTQEVLRLPRPLKRASAMAVDMVLCAVTVLVAFYLRLDTWVPLTTPYWAAVFGSTFLALPIFAVSGLYRYIFRHAEASFARLAQAGLVYAVLYAAIFTVVQFDNVPRTVGIVQPILLFITVATSRIAASWWLGGAYPQALGQDRRNVMIYGAGIAGRQLHRGLMGSEMRVAAFLDDDETLQGQILLGSPVYAPGNLRLLVDRLDVTDILLAIPSASRSRRNEILEWVRPLDVSIRTLPDMMDLAKGLIKADELRQLTIEDLLGRDAVPPEADLLTAKIAGLTVLVTGAGGSIGSEICRQAAALAPKMLLLVENSEAALYRIHQELENRSDAEVARTRIVPLLGSVCDPERMAGIMTAWRPDTIYHAAAYKHVPLVEHNPTEGLANNVLGTLTVVRAAIAAGVADFVLISTDKAVRPTNVMGASKRVAEMILQALDATSPATRFSMVRFGNVLGSSGSVVPLFREQIRAGGPITITHPEITRYFMTIPEAAQLVIQAGSMANGGEVFVLDMGDPVKIVDLARLMVELSGLRVRDEANSEGDIELSFVGLRPGEKLYEELLSGNNPQTTRHERIMRADEPCCTWPELRPKLDELDAAIEASDVARALRLLRGLVADYTPEGNVVDWVHLQSKAG